MTQLLMISGLTKSAAEDRAAELSMDATEPPAIIPQVDGTFTVRAMLPDGMDVPGAVPVEENGGTGNGSAAASDGPPWYVVAKTQIGIREVGGSNDGPEIVRYRQLARCGAPGDPWCAIFVNAMLASCTPTVPGTKSPSSQSFRTSNNFVKIDGPALGAVTVFWRGSPDSEQGHVGFYSGETADSIFVLGGNEDNMVEIEPVPRNQLRGFWWPASLAKPVMAAITLSSGTPKTRTQLT